MKKDLKYFILLMLLTINVYSQAPNIEWQKTFGGTENEEGFSVCLTHGGYYAITGYTRSSNVYIVNSHGFHDFWIIKIDSLGNLFWNNCYGGGDAEISHAIKQTLDSGFIIAGDASSPDGDVTGVHFGRPDFWVVKTDKTGILEWQKCIGGDGWDFAYSIIQTADSGYLVTGETMSFDGDVTGFHGGTDVLVVKLSSSGTIQWTKALGGSDWDGGQSCVQRLNGNYLITGTAASIDGDVTGNHNSSTDVWVVELDSAGNLLWQKCYGGSGIDNANSILLSDDGGFYISAFSSSNDGDISGNHGSADMLLIKADSVGVIEWQRCYGGVNTERSYSSCLTSDGGVLLVGFAGLDDGMVTGNHGGTWPYYSDFWAIKTDSIGNFEWGKCLGGTAVDVANDAIETPDGGYLIVGTTESNDYDVTNNLGGKDVWVVKLSSPFSGIPQIENELMDISITSQHEQLLLRFFSKHSGIARANIFDSQGKMVLTEKIKINEGINYHIFNDVNFAQGMYYVNIEGDARGSGKVVVQ